MFAFICYFMCFFPNSFSYGVLANIGSYRFRGGAGAASEPWVPGRFRGSVPGQGFGKVPRVSRRAGLQGFGAMFRNGVPGGSRQGSTGRFLREPVAVALVPPGTLNNHLEMDVSIG